MNEADSIATAPAQNERITTLGRAWVDEVCETLKVEGRRPVGMWPGTMTEARALLCRAPGSTPRGSGSTPRPPTHEERELEAQALYAVARRFWLSRREPEDLDHDSVE